MVERVFIQRSRLGRTIFTLRADQLEITSYMLGTRRDAVIPVRSISPEYELRGVRLLRAVALLLLPLAAALVFYRWSLSHPGWPDFVRGYLLWLTIPYAGAALKLYPRFEVFVFKNHFKRPLFTVLREPGQKAECQAFIHGLLDRIETLDGEPGMPGVTRPVPSEAETAEAESRDVARWKLAVALSLVSVVVPPLVDWVWPEYDGVLLPAVIVCSGGAVIAAIYSFAKKEPRRWWSAAAAVIALIPVFFY